MHNLDKIGIEYFLMLQFQMKRKGTQASHSNVSLLTRVSRGAFEFAKEVQTTDFVEIGASYILNYSE